MYLFCISCKQIVATIKVPTLVFIICIIILDFSFCQRTSYLSTDSVGVVSGFHHRVNENFTRLGRSQRRLVVCYRHFGTTYRPPSSRVKQCPGPFTMRDILKRYILKFLGDSLSFRSYAMNG